MQQRARIIDIKNTRKAICFQTLGFFSFVYKKLLDRAIKIKSKRASGCTHKVLLYVL